MHLGTICLCSTALLALCFTERRTLSSTQLEMPLNPSHCQNHSSLSVICLPQPKSQRQLRLSKNTAGRFQPKISKECQSVLKLSWCHILGHPHKCRSQNCSVCPAHHCCNWLKVRPAEILLHAMSNWCEWLISAVHLGILGIRPIYTVVLPRGNYKQPSKSSPCCMQLYTREFTTSVNQKVTET